MAISTRNRDQIDGLIINQLADSPQYVALLSWLAQSFDTVDDMLNYVATINVETATGVWLDLIGVIVGQSREVPNALLFEYFGFEDEGGLSFDTGRFYLDGEPLTAASILPDEEYRTVIIARIARNYGDISQVGIAEAIQNITGTDGVKVWTRAPAGFEVYIDSAISSNVAAILRTQDIVPRGAGIGVRAILQSDGANVFGFEEDGQAAFDDAPFATEII